MPQCASPPGAAGMEASKPSRLWTHGDSTEVKFQGSNDDMKEEHVMIVRPVEHAYILSGRMMLTFTVGTWVLKRSWPLVTLIVTGLLLHTANIFAVFARTAEMSIADMVVTVSSPTAATWCTHAITTLCWGLATAVILTRVHSQLLWMTLRTFDPWAIIACALRGWSAQMLSRMSLQHDAQRTEDVFDFINMLQLSVLIVLVEAADLPRTVQRTFVAACLVYSCTLAAAALCVDQLPNWDPHARVELLFFVSMSPKSQFIGAYATMALLLLKATASVIVQNHHFMFLRCPLMYCLDEVDGSFRKLAQMDPGFVTLSDFQAAMLEMGVSDSHVRAGFNALDVNHTGRVTPRDFRRCMKEVFLECPGASHEALLTRLCQNAFGRNTGYDSLDSMLGLVMSQWRQIKLDELGKTLYGYLMLEGNVHRLFKTVNVRVQALLFAAVVQVGLTWLEEKNFRVVERDITSLGMRHIGYGVHPSHLCLFQLALLRSLGDLLKGLSERAEMAWSLVWLRFIAAPFTQGRLCQQDTDRATVASTVRNLLRKASADERFIPRLVANLSKVPAGEHDWRSTIFRDTEHELSHMAMLASFLEDTADKLYDGDVAGARRRLRQVVSIHWDRGVFPRHMLTFQYAATITFRDILGLQVFNEQAEALWAVFFQMEILDTLLLAPFAEMHDKMESWATACKMPYVNQAAWNSLMEMGGVSSDLSLKGYRRFCAESWKEASKITPDDVLRTLCDECMRHPSWTFAKVVRSYCSTKPMVELLE